MATSLKSLFTTLFGFSQTVDRKTYVLAGFGLGILKYLLDAALVWIAADHFWTPLSYLMPVLTLRQEGLGPEASGATATIVLGVMALYTLPFLWVGLTMSVRRAADADISPWWGIFFLVPGLNWLLILALCLIPSRSSWQWDEQQQAMPLQLGVAISAIALGIAQSLGMVLLNVYIFGQYGWVLFLTTPCVVGLFAGYLLNRKRRVSLGSTLATALLTIALSGVSLLLFALEGLICILMALPLALIAGGAGAIAGRAIALYMLARRGGGDDEGGGGADARAVALVLLALPMLTGAESVSSNHQPLHEVETVVIVDAPPARVWHEVVYFSELPPAAGLGRGRRHRLPDARPPRRRGRRRGAPLRVLHRPLRRAHHRLGAQRAARLRCALPAAADARVEPLSVRPPPTPGWLLALQARRVSHHRPARRAHSPRGLDLV